MRIQKQAFRHRPEEGLIGDCHRTCLAMMLDLDRDEVPNFAAMGFDISDPDGNSKIFKDEVKGWLADRGLAQVDFVFQCELPDLLNYMAQINPGVYYILGGESKTGVNHSVVCLDDQILADPSLDDSGIVGPCQPDGFYWITVLIPLHQKA